MSEHMVRVYDSETRQVTNMPARELAPGMILARVEGVEGEVWVESSRLRLAPHQHPPFAGERLARVRRLQQSLCEVDPRTAEEWEDGFRRDGHPDRELDIWEHIVRVYQHFTAGRSGLSLKVKKRVFGEAVLCSMSDRPDTVVHSCPRGPLSTAQVREIAEHYWRTKGG